MTTEMQAKDDLKVTRVDDEYAWAVCSCGNTVKFTVDYSFGCCPNCDGLWACDGDRATDEGEWGEEDGFSPQW